MSDLTANELRQKYLDFFSKKLEEKYRHTVIPSAPLVPENDPTTLFTSSGMQPLVPNLLGQPHAMGTRLVDSQKCFRSQDIEEVGDNRHTTFFEMLGNWSLGDYFKKEQLTWIFTFLTQEVGLNPQKLFVTVFRGNEKLDINRDTEAVEIWQSLFKTVGIEAKAVDHAEEKGMQDGRIFSYDEHKNWWSRSGIPDKMPAGEPGGPDSEVFYDFGAELKLHENSSFKNKPCHVNCDCGRFLEIGNSVFMQYQKQTDGSFKELPQKNVDFGGGLERMLAAAHNDPDVFNTDSFITIIDAIQRVTGADYKQEKNKKIFRIVADHLKASTFLIKDGVEPSNKKQGYVLRRLLRRSFVKLKQLQPRVNEADIVYISEAVMDLYKGTYFNDTDKKMISEKIGAEIFKFTDRLGKALKKLEEFLISNDLTTPNNIALHAFSFFSTDGLPVDVFLDEVERLKGYSFSVDERQEIQKEFSDIFESHKNLSRTASAGMFKGGLADHSEVTTKYHTATHLLHAALRKVLGDHAQQKGSNITVERLRFDFSHPQAMTEAEVRQVEAQINDWIKADLPVTVKTMKKAEALNSGAIAFFVEKYPDDVTVYTIGRDPETDWISKEFCGGPHVNSTGEIGPVKIQKEQSASAGVRRIYIALQ